MLSKISSRDLVQNSVAEANDRQKRDGGGGIGPMFGLSSNGGRDMESLKGMRGNASGAALGTHHLEEEAGVTVLPPFLPPPTRHTARLWFPILLFFIDHELVHLGTSSGFQEGFPGTLRATCLHSLQPLIFFWVCCSIFAQDCHLIT